MRDHPVSYKMQEVRCNGTVCVHNDVVSPGLEEEQIEVRSEPAQSLLCCYVHRGHGSWVAERVTFAASDIEQQVDLGKRASISFTGQING